MRQNLPSWVAFWLLLSSIICAIDAFFVLLRPHTLPGGKWNYLFKPCEYGAFYTPLISRLCFWLENCVLEIFEQGRTLIQNGRDRKTGMLVGLRGRVKSAHLVLTKVQRGKLNIFTNVLYEIWVIIQGRIQEFLIGGPNCGKSEEQLPKKTVGQLCYHLMWKISANCRQTVSRQLAACW